MGYLLTNDRRLLNEAIIAGMSMFIVNGNADEELFALRYCRFLDDC